MLDHGLNKEIRDMRDVFNQMEIEVANCFVDKKYFEIEKKELILENDRLLEHIICQDVMNIVMHADVHSYNVLPANNNFLEHDNLASKLLKHINDRLMELLISQDLVHTAAISLAAINDYKNMEKSFMDEYNETLGQKAKLAKKHDMIEKDEAHVDYLKHTQENPDILREIVEQAKELRPLDSDLDSACKFVTRIQELLVYVSATCSGSKHVSDKLVAVTPINKTRKVRFAESSDTSKDKTQKQVKLQDKQTTNNSVSPSTGVSSSIEARGSKPRRNTKKDRITQTSSSNKKKNKVEYHPRIAKFSLNNVNRVSKPMCNENVKHSMLNVNSELICATCNECVFDAIHDLCVYDYLNDVNARVKSKSAMSNKKKMWKPTGKVYTDVGYS
ncbi:hypothetical protein Tco_1320090 [Tanacetum coccineum]